MKFITNYLKNRAKKKKILAISEEMAKFIEDIPRWREGCGHNESRLCDCNSDISVRITLENIEDEASELSQKWNNEIKL